MTQMDLGRLLSETRVMLLAEDVGSIVSVQVTNIPSETLVPGDPMSSSDLYDTACTWCTYTQAKYPYT